MRYNVLNSGRNRGIKELRKNSFVEGSLIAYLSIVITKMMGVLYNIPLYRIIGDQGGFIYSCAYSIYVLFLSFSTSGIPVAMSILIGEYNALGKQKSKEKTYRMGMRFVAIVSILGFIAIQIFAPSLSSFFLHGAEEGVHSSDLANAFRVVSFCLLIVPFLSVERGYMQGHKFIAVSSVSQVIEQAVRIAVVLAGASVAVFVFNKSAAFAVRVALSGAAVSALAAYLYILAKKRANREFFQRTAEEIPEDSTHVIAKKLVKYCSTVVILSIAINVYNIVDIKLLIFGLTRLGYSDVNTQTIVGIFSNWAPKISMITAALTMGMMHSIAPHIADSFARNDLKDVSKKLNQALSVILCINLPLTLGLMLFAEPVYNVFYGQSPYGSGILIMSLGLTFVNGVVTVLGMSMQSMGKGKLIVTITIAGILMNTACDLPLIFLFDKIGIPAYRGATASSIISQIAVFAVLVRSLIRDIHFAYRPSLNTAKKIALPLAAMAGCVLAIKWIWPAEGIRRLPQVFRLLVIGLAGVAVYFPLICRSGALEPLFDNPKAKKILKLAPVAKILKATRSKKNENGDDND